jgi:hypothetical protein
MDTDKMTKARQQFAAEGWKIASITGDTHLKRTLEMCEELWVESYLEEAKPEKCQTLHQMLYGKRRDHL